MAKCIGAREVTVAFRHKKHKDDSWSAQVICPLTWKKGQFLKYVRENHPNETVRIEAWPIYAVALWMVAPEEMMASARRI